MSEADIYRQLTGIFEDVFDSTSITLHAGTCAADIESWDSFNHINLMVAIESSFRIKFSTANLEAMSSVGDIVKLIEQKTALIPA